MDHAFKDRVDKVFGSISSSSSSTPWSLTDAQVERRIWNRHKAHDRDDDQTLVSSSFHHLFNTRKAVHHQPIGVADDDKSENLGDEWDIRSSIGLDSTLDNEEEEDAYDKMAEGRENVGDRLYMKDVTDHGPYLNSHNVLPSSVHDVEKDPRANHDAAKTRLKEDDAVGENPGSSQGSDEPMLNAEEPCVPVPASEDGIRIKSILKRKSDAVVKPAKRVRFDSTCKNDDEGTNTVRLQGFPLPEASEDGGGVPDYILNPSKYTRYSFDDSSHDINEGSNSDAYLEFLEHVKNSKHVGLAQKSGESSADLPKSVFFIPRKKRGDGEATCNSEGQFKQSSTQAGSGVGIAAGEEQQGEISEMQEDESHVDAICTKARFQKSDRRYRTKREAGDDVC